MISMTNEQLVANIKAGKDIEKNMSQLYNQVERFIHAVAWKYKDSGELEDLEQEGFLAIYPAIDGYDPAQGVKFLTYAEYWIKQRIQRYLQINGCCLRLSVHSFNRLQQYKRLCSSFYLKHGREPSDREAAYYLGLSLEQIWNIKDNMYISHLGSLDSPVTGKEGSEDSIVGDFVPSNEKLEEDAIERIDRERLCSVLWECVDSLPGKQPAIIRLRFQEGKTLKEAGEAIGTTAEGARTWQQKALRELRKPSRAKRLRPFLPECERIYSMGITGNGAEHFNRTWTSSTERAALTMSEEWERERQERLELLEKLKGRVATSQQTDD